MFDEGVGDGRRGVHRLVSERAIGTAGHEVVCLDNFFTGRRDNVRHLLDSPSFQLLRHDVCEPLLLEVDQIYNLACPASPVHYQYNPIKTVKSNVMGALNMQVLARRVGARIVQASTSCFPFEERRRAYSEAGDWTDHHRPDAARCRVPGLGVGLVSAPELRIVILGLSITSSWGNGHATTYRGLVRELTARGHSVLFLERDVEWHAANRDLPRPPHGQTLLYRTLAELKRRFASQVRAADLVIVGSYVPEGAEVGEWVTRTAHGITAFYDIDTPVTLARLARGEVEYLTRALIRRYHLYLSFTGGPTLERLERDYGAQAARALYCAVDPEIYHPEQADLRYDLGYMGTYSTDRQRGLTHLLMEPARLWWEGRFAVAGPQYPATIRWPANVRRIEHLPPDQHRNFYNAQRFTLNLTRADMIAAGFSPSVRLFEAAACGTPIVSDAWDGIGDVLTPGREVLLARSAGDVLAYVRDFPEDERLAVGARARERILAEHSAAHRAEELEGHVLGLLARQGSP